MRTAEWELFRDVRLRALRDSPHAFGSTLEEAEGLTQPAWRDRLRARVAYVAELGGRPVGLVGVVPGEVLGEAELISMWVDPAVRRRGVGEQLVRRVIQLATRRGASRLRLWVAAGNEPAEHLYGRLGFRRTGEVQPMDKAGGTAMEFAMSMPLGAGPDNRQA